MKFLFFSFFSLFCIEFQAQIPTEQVTQYVVKDTFAWKVNIQIKVPTSSDSALVVISRNNISTLTIPNQFYGIGQNIVPGAKVYRKFFKGNSPFTFYIYGLEANTTYNLAFYTFNNNGAGINYSTSPLKVSFKTKGRTIGNYYKTLDTNQAVFLSKLSLLLRNHNFSSYDDFDTYIISELYEKDTFISNASKKFVTCEYSNIKAYYTGNFTFVSTNFNREHTLPKNWMNFRGIPNGDLVDHPEGADYHNLTLTDGTANQLRSDYVFKTPTKSVKTIGTARYSDNTGNYSDTNNCFEPQASYRGNAARCVFYMQLCYNGQDNNKWGFKTGLNSFAKNQNQELLKTWARTDTVDNFEIARNECIAAVQKSRNPFIDFPDWIDCIDFNNITQLKTCQGLYVNDSVITGSISSNKNSNWDVWYYPNSENQYILKLYNDQIENIGLTIYDFNGKLIEKQVFRSNIDENSYFLPLTMSKGIYFLNFKSDTKQKTLKLLYE